MTFEESIKKLEEMAAKIKAEDVALEEAIECYEEGIKCYQTCCDVLRDARQKIEVFDKKEREES